MNYKIPYASLTRVAQLIKTDSIKSKLYETHIKRKTINYNYNITSITCIGISTDFCVFRVFCIGLKINKKWTSVFESKAINCTGTRVGGAISKITKLCHSGFGSLYILMRNLIIIATSKNYGKLEILLKSCKIGRYLGKVGDREVKARVSLGGLEGMEQPTFRTYFNKCVNFVRFSCNF